MVLEDESVIVIADGSFIIIGFLFIYDVESLLIME